MELKKEPSQDQLPSGPPFPSNEYLFRSITVQGMSQLLPILSNYLDDIINTNHQMNTMNKSIIFLVSEFSKSDTWLIISNQTIPPKRSTR